MMVRAWQLPRVQASCRNANTDTAGVWALSPPNTQYASWDAVILLHLVRDDSPPAPI
jgi:hypothetical protein